MAMDLSKILWPHARFDTIADVIAALGGWMHRVCADLAGCYDTSVVWSGSAPVMPFLKQILRVGEGRCVRPRVSGCKYSVNNARAYEWQLRSHLA